MRLYIRYPFLVVLAVCLLHSCSINRLTKIGVYKELAPNDYLVYVKDSSINLIDVRTRSEYEKSHIEGALNASYFGGNFKEDVKAMNLDKSKTTLIYCETQHRSLFVAKKLYRAGYQSIIDLDKGMMHWRKNGFPYVSDTTSTTK